MSLFEEKLALTKLVLSITFIGSFKQSQVVLHNAVKLSKNKKNITQWKHIFLFGSRSPFGFKLIFKLVKHQVSNRLHAVGYLLYPHGGVSLWGGDVTSRGFPHAEAANQSEAASGNTKLSQTARQISLNTWIVVRLTAFHGSVQTY